ncbi:AAA family ATPase [Rhodovastum atsumiense]|uniref:AAA family ATPase n=1 Tax=Rhodovastum atsumiense TaxID=504468 RepID=A0A5M6J2E8_9PROT|nr:cellulose synthase operon protein YhjQ/BcsQ [Rhodovastum atsumiense]KAA5614701.1 AAA family ATPase [Rhodovastum atsumiense]CAH2599765.1 AAA family ATPase [Rhodovastum atsumiense]
MPLICFASPKGGVGKTTLAANVACELVRTGREVVAIDIDPQNALRLTFGVPLDDAMAFTSRLAARPDWRRCARMTAPGVCLLAHGPCSHGAALALAAAIAADPGLLVDPLREMLVAHPQLHVVVDTMSGPTPQLGAVTKLADLTVAVLLADAASAALIPAIERGDLLGGQAPERVVFALNQFDPRPRLAPAIAEVMSRQLGDRLLGCVYRDENVGEAIAAQLPVAEYAPGAKAAQDLAQLAAAIAGRLSVPATTPGQGAEAASLGGVPA